MSTLPPLLQVMGKTVTPGRRAVSGSGARATSRGFPSASARFASRTLAAQPHFPRLHITTRNARRDLPFPGSISKTRGGPDLCETPLIAGRITVDHHQQAHRFLVAPPNIIGKASHLLQNKAGSAM